MASTKPQIRVTQRVLTELTTNFSEHQTLKFLEADLRTNYRLLVQFVRDLANKIESGKADSRAGARLKIAKKALELQLINGIPLPKLADLSRKARMDPNKRRAFLDFYIKQMSEHPERFSNSSGSELDKRLQQFNKERFNLAA